MCLVDGQTNLNSPCVRDVLEGNSCALLEVKSRGDKCVALSDGVEDVGSIASGCGGEPLEGGEVPEIGKISG